MNRGHKVESISREPAPTIQEIHNRQPLLMSHSRWISVFKIEKPKKKK